MAELNVIAASEAGAEVTLATADDGAGDSFENDGRTMLEIENSTGGEVDVTVKGQRNCNYGEKHDLVLTVADASTKVYGPFDPHWFNDGQGQAHLEYSAAGLTLAPIKV